MWFVTNHIIHITFKNKLPVPCNNRSVCCYGDKLSNHEEKTMAKESVEVLISGGKATAAPPLGPALGPLGVNIGKVVADINEKTKSFAGMQVPVKVTVDKDTKEYEISIGTPPTSQLVKKEAGIDKGASNPLAAKVADLKIQQVLKIAKMKESALLGKDDVQRVKEICGTCDSMGVLVEGMPGRKAVAAIKEGQFVDLIKSGRTDISAEELKALEEEKKHLQEQAAKDRAKYEAQARVILDQNKNKEARTIKKAMKDAGIPDTVINAIAPAEEKKK